MVMWDKRYPLWATVVLLNLLFNAAAVADDNSDEAPSMELLEFLGEFQTQDGQWMDPVQFLETDQSETLRSDEDSSYE